MDLVPNNFHEVPSMLSKVTKGQCASETVGGKYYRLVVVKLISRVVFVLRKMEKALFVYIQLQKTIPFQELSWI